MRKFLVTTCILWVKVLKLEIQINSILKIFVLNYNISVIYGYCRHFDCNLKCFVAYAVFLQILYGTKLRTEVLSRLLIRNTTSLALAGALPPGTEGEGARLGLHNISNFGISSVI